MKKFVAFIFLYTIFTFTSFSQVVPEFIFSEVVVLDSVGSEILFKNGKEWVVKNGLQSIDTTLLNRINAEASFFVYQKGLISKQIHGKVHYTFFLEVKDNKYRYTFSDFVFHYYKQNRNYEMKPTGKEKSLNDLTAKGWQKTWDQHKNLTQKNIQLLIQSLKVSLPLTPQSKIVKKSTTSDF